MEILYSRCCGLDVHQKTVVACVRTPEGKETRTFKAMTGELLELADWLAAKGTTHVAMESTGVYWLAGLQPFGAIGFYPAGGERPSHQNGPGA